MATPLCAYVKFNGVQCGSPSLRGKVFCYHHARSRTARQSNIIIPPPDSPDAMMYTNHALLQLMFNKKITISEYRAAVHGFRITATFMKMSEKYSDQPRVTGVSRHVEADIAFAGPDADMEEEPVAVGARLASPAAEEHQVTGRDFSHAAAPQNDRALAPGEAVSARLASPAAEEHQVTGRDFSHAAAPQNDRASAPAAVGHDSVVPDFSPGLQAERAKSANASGIPAAFAAALNLEPPVELQPNSRTPTVLGASITHAGLADPISLDPALKENAKLDPRPHVPPPEFKFPPRPLTQEEIDNPYVRPTSDALADYLNREYLKRRGPFR